MRNRQSSHNQGSYNQHRYDEEEEGQNENYPSSYSVYPMPGATKPANCTGSKCCYPKCYAEKGARVRRKRSKCFINFFYLKN